MHHPTLYNTYMHQPTLHCMIAYNMHQSTVYSVLHCVIQIHRRRSTSIA